MKKEPPRLAPGEILAALLLAALPARAAPAAAEGPMPAFQLPTVEVIESANRKPDLSNPLFDHTFADLRSGPLIEAILWRHRYLEDHPREEAVIVTTHQGERTLSATTLYTREGKLYGSSNVLGDSFLLKGCVAADLHRTEGIARAQKFLAGVRLAMGDALLSANGADPQQGNEALGLTIVTPDAVPALEAALSGVSFLNMPHQGGGGSRSIATPLVSAYAGVVHAADSADALSPGLGPVLVNAEETGDYRILGRMAGAPTPVDVGRLRRARIPDELILQMITEKLQSNLELRRTFFQPFAAPSGEVLQETYRALRNSARAGIVPVTLASFGGQGSAVALPAFAKSARIPSRQQTCLIFDWEGVQYYYQPDVGTWARPLPRNALTGRPYLCLKHGALMECAYFCATYAQRYPDRKAQLVPGDPVMAAYEADGKLGLFIPELGPFTLPKEYLEALGDENSLGQLRDQLVTMAKGQGKPPVTLPAEMPGDDGDLQMRRALLAFQAAGISCRLDEQGPPALTFTWDQMDYVYGPDQQVRPAAP
jgi:hypothetical protein